MYPRFHQIPGVPKTPAAGGAGGFGGAEALEAAGLPEIQGGLPGDLPSVQGALKSWLVNLLVWA